MTNGGPVDSAASPEERVQKGERYEVVVPDTLDLADRARLALGGLGGTIDPDCHHNMFFWVRFCRRPPVMEHFSADVTCDPKFAESFPMMRLMCGDDLHADIESAQRVELLSRLSSDDGLYYNLADPDRPWRSSYQPVFDGELSSEDTANVGGNGRMLRALVTWRENERNTDYDEHIRALVRGLARIAIERDDYAYYPDCRLGEPFSRPRSGWPSTREPQSETEGAEGSVVAYHGHQIQGLMRWYAVSGDPAALELARKLTRFCALPKFWGGVVDLGGNREGFPGHVAPGRPDPPGIAGHEQGHWYTHFHARGIGLRGILEYARLVQDQRLLEFVRRAYEFTLSMGIGRVGWVDCWPGTGDRGQVEGCALGDLVALGIRLSDAGMGDYWDDVDAVVRNHLIEGQLVRADLLERVSAAGEAVPVTPSKRVCAENVIARALGNFAGSSTPADIPEPWVMQCCTGNGTQGLYYAWEGIVRGDGDGAQVNLLLNRASRWLDIDSHLPYEGKVEILVKKARRLAVRIPCWVERRKVLTSVNGVIRQVPWVGNYVTLGELKPGDRLTLEFPVPETSASYTIAANIPGQEQVYEFEFRGSTAIDVSPHDDSATSIPLYRRDHMRAGKAPAKRVTRFVADRPIVMW